MQGDSCIHTTRPRVSSESPGSRFIGQPRFVHYAPKGLGASEEASDVRMHTCGCCAFFHCLHGLSVLFATGIISLMGFPT